MKSYVQADPVSETLRFRMGQCKFADYVYHSSFRDRIEVWVIGIGLCSRCDIQSRRCIPFMSSADQPIKLNHRIRQASRRIEARYEHFIQMRSDVTTLQTVSQTQIACSPCVRCKNHKRYRKQKRFLIDCLLRAKSLDGRLG